MTMAVTTGTVAEVVAKVAAVTVIGISLEGLAHVCHHKRHRCDGFSSAHVAMVAVRMVVAVAVAIAMTMAMPTVTVAVVVVAKVTAVTVII